MHRNVYTIAHLASSKWSCLKHLRQLDYKENAAKPTIWAAGPENNYLMRIGQADFMKGCKYHLGHL
jgi:hypothetical protein